MARHPVLVAGMADAEPHPAVIRCAQHAVHAAQAVMPGRAAARFTRTLPGARSSSSWKAVIAVGRQLVEGGRRLHRFAGGVHVGQRLQRQHLLRRRRVPSATSPLKRCRHGEKPWRVAMTSSAMKPILWRLPGHPGLRIAEADPEQHARQRAGQPTSWRRALRPAALGGAAALWRRRLAAAGAAAAGSGRLGDHGLDLGRRRDRRDDEVTLDDRRRACSRCPSGRASGRCR